MKDYPLNTFYGDIYGSYDKVNRIFTFGRDRAWRKKAADELLKRAPSRVLDLCTGTGDFAFELARQADPSADLLSLTGFDFSQEMLQEARRKLSGFRSGNSRVDIQFIEGDAREMPFAEGHFDSMGITFGLRNLVYENTHASIHLKEMNRILKKGGELVVLESSKPSNGLWRFFNDLYLRFVLPYLGGLISGNLKAYQYLARSSRNYYTREEMGGILEEAGFRVRRSRSLFMGSVMLLVLEKPYKDSVYE